MGSMWESAQTVTTVELFEQMRPTGDRILVRREEPDERTAGGLVIPPRAQTRGETGRVLAVGEGLVSKRTGARREMEVRQGDRILLGPHNGLDLEVDGERFALVHESDVLAVLV